MTPWDWAYAAAGAAVLPRLAGRPWRDRLGERFGSLPRVAGHPRVWFHMASMGEVRAAAPLVRAVRRGFPAVRLTTVTATGREEAAKQEGAAVSYAPLDLSPFVTRAFDRARPDLIVLVEQELWPNLLGLARRRRVPVLLASARMTARSAARYRWFPHVFHSLTRVIAQDEAAAERYVACGVPRERVSIGGNLKFDAPPPGDPDREFAKAWKLGRAPVIVGGSTHAPEEEWLARALPDGARLILVPRYVERAGEAEQAARAAGRTVARASAGGGDARVIVVDRMGMLGRLYGLATAAFVGGTVAPKGGHNLLEPAAWGVPIIVGPDLEKIRDAADRLREGGGLQVARSPEDLVAALTRALTTEAREAASRAGKALVDSGRGAVERHAAAVRELLESRLSP